MSAKGRPKIKNGTKKVQISISVSPIVKAAAEATGNASKFFEEAAAVALDRVRKQDVAASVTIEKRNSSEA